VEGSDLQFCFCNEGKENQISREVKEMPLKPVKLNRNQVLSWDGLFRKLGE
jgi:hypothetical protein